ncbi:MAG: pseudouridine synthase [bacterium]|nr:rRNA pseudouridine synthase [Acidimicrobiia bacterium]MCY4650561.1 pseudouridine synthase [bacterium]
MKSQPPRSSPDRRIRLQKAISAAGLMSRRAAEDLIRGERVTIDGRTARLGDRVDPDASVVEVDGSRLPLAPHLVTYLVNKPPGVVSTTSDPHAPRTVVELVPHSPRVWPVGRLDQRSEGLILVSNDGELTNLVTHPRYGISKTYRVLVAGVPGRATVRRLTKGVQLEDGPARALQARLVDRTPREAQLEVVMGEGRNREIRRMMKSLGYPVRRLVRVSIGPIRDVTLRPGRWRKLSNREVAALYRAASRE